MPVLWIDPEPVMVPEGGIDQVATLIASMSANLVHTAMAPAGLNRDQVLENARAVVSACVVVATHIRSRSLEALDAAMSPSPDLAD